MGLFFKGFFAIAFYIMQISMYFAYSGHLQHSSTAFNSAVRWLRKRGPKAWYSQGRRPSSPPAPQLPKLFIAPPPCYSVMGPNLKCCFWHRLAVFCPPPPFKNLAGIRAGGGRKLGVLGFLFLLFRYGLANFLGDSFPSRHGFIFPLWGPKPWSAAIIALRWLHCPPIYAKLSFAPAYC